MPYAPGPHASFGHGSVAPLQDYGTHTPPSPSPSPSLFLLARTPYLCLAQTPLITRQVSWIHPVSRITQPCRCMQVPCISTDTKGDMTNRRDVRNMRTRLRCISHLGHRLNNMTHYMKRQSPTALCMSVCVCTHRYTVLHSRRKFKLYPRVPLEVNDSRRAFVYRYILVCIHSALNQEMLFYSGLNRRSERTEEHTSETHLTHTTVVPYTCCV